MPGQFLSPDGDLESAFVSDPAIIDQFAKTGSLWNWGFNFMGALGDNTQTNRSSPVQTISLGTNWQMVSCGKYHTLAIKTDGTLWGWGKNDTGQLGDGTVQGTNSGRSSPVQTVAGGTNWKIVSVGEESTSAIKTDGTLWMWGKNNNGQLGDNTTTTRSSPVQTSSLGTNWKQVSCGGYTTGSIKTDGTLWMWGRNSYGQLGDNTATSKSTPTQVTGTTWKIVSVSGYHFTGAIKTDGTLWTWGQNNYGQLGDNTTNDKSSPVQITGTNWKYVASGMAYLGGFMSAIKTDGTLWMWGRNNQGQFGDGTYDSKSSPVQITGTNWKMISNGGAELVGAIKTDGTLWMWGKNGSGQLGDNTTTGRNSPVQTIVGGTNWKMVSVGGYHAAAIHFYDAGNLYP